MVVSVTRGFVPALGYGWEMTVKSDLSVVDVNYEPKVECVARVTPDQWSALLGRVEEAHFFELQDAYTSDPRQPIPFFTRVVRTDAHKTIYALVGQPFALSQLDAHLAGLRLALQWTGRAGDAAAEEFCPQHMRIRPTS